MTFYELTNFMACTIFTPPYSCANELSFIQWRILTKLTMSFRHKNYKLFPKYYWEGYSSDPKDLTKIRLWIIDKLKKPRIRKDNAQTTWIATCNTRNRACFLGLEDLIPACTAFRQAGLVLGIYTELFSKYQGKAQNIKQNKF